jgi:hypothetical protein
MRFLYKPFGIFAGVIGARLGQNVFKSVWEKVDGSEPPRPATREASLPKVVAASALEAGTLAAVAAAVDRLSMRWFHHLTGFWPAEKKKQRADAEA